MISRDKTKDLLGLAFWLILTFGVAYLSSQFEPGEWYRTISKPSWTPPGWIFGPVWSLLYLSMGVSAWLVWRKRTGEAVRLPLSIYLVQLIVNGLWSWFFFGRQMIGVALLDLVILVLVVSINLVLFMRIDRRAGVLLIPYLIWICFAAALNFQIWRLN
jgi:tryptophan-rich sensory protein